MKTYLIIILMFIISSEGLYSQHASRKYFPETDSLVLKKLERWQDFKFGLLMHWGTYSQWGIVESWSICPEDYGWCERKKGGNPENYYEYVKEYENLQTTFNPVKFDPGRWAKAAREAGMRYVIFTTKHHDGFCMFDSRYTDYKITSERCPFHTNPQADITKAVFDAFRDEGLWVGAYFSKPDWHSNNYWWPYFPPKDRNVNYDPAQYPERWEKFVQYTHNQILELMTNYGKVDILWLDGGWVRKKDSTEIARRYDNFANNAGSGFIKSTTVNQDIKMDELVTKVRAKQPGIIVVDRAVTGKNQNYLTPENTIPDKALAYPWESCIISGGGWSWTHGAKYMSGQKLVHLLVDVVSKGGNLLLNIAPGPDGQWDPAAYKMLDEMAKWMKINSEAIYDTRAMKPYKENNICFTQKKDGTVFLIYLADENQKQMPEKIEIGSFCPAGNATIELLGTKTKLKWTKNKKGFTVFIPRKIRENPPCEHAWSFKIS